MSDHDFLFSIALSDQAHFDEMLTDCVATVLRFVGFAAPDVSALAEEIRRACAEGPAESPRRCDVRFRARGGELEIVASGGAGHEWRTTRPLP